MSKNQLILPAKDLVLGNGQERVSIQDKVFLGVPTRTGLLSSGSAQAALTQVTASRVVLYRASAHTNLELNYNMLLCDALNLRDRDGVKWFAMLHDDIQPEPYWVDILIDEAEKFSADLMSAHAPLKDDRGLTSTALSDPDDPWCPFVRLTTKQIHHADFPETISTQNATEALRNLPDPYCVDCPVGSQLLINTGCMVIRLDRQWMDHICFHKRDEIVHEAGVWAPMSWTEDWILAQDLHDMGARVMATRKVRLTHWDGKRFFSNEPCEHGYETDQTTISIRADRRKAMKEINVS